MFTDRPMDKENKKKLNATRLETRKYFFRNEPFRNKN